MKRNLALLILGSGLVLAAGAAPLELSDVQLSEGLAVVGDKVQLGVTLTNTTGSDLQNVVMDLVLPPGWLVNPGQVQFPVVGAYTSERVRITLIATTPGRGVLRLVVNGGGLVVPATAAVDVASCLPLANSMVVDRLTKPAVEQLPEDGCLYVATGSYLLFLPKMAEGYGAGLVYLRRGRDWTRMATLPALGRVIYADGPPDASYPVEHRIFGERVDAPLPPGRQDHDGWYLLTLRDQWIDQRGRTWIAKAYFAPTHDPRVIKCTQSLWCNGSVRLYRFEGPQLSVGDGTFATRRLATWVGSGPELTGTTPVLQRTGAVDRGVLAIEPPVGGAVGLLWDPNQLWVAGKAQPQGLIASPNVLFGQSNQYLSLVVPHFAPDQPADADQAQPGMVIPAGRPVFLRAMLFVAADGTLAEANAAWDQHCRRGPGD